MPIIQGRQRCIIQCPAQINTKDTKSIIVKLIDEHVPLMQELIGSWEFAPIDMIVEDIVVDLWALDYFTVSIRSSATVQVCKTFRRNQHFGSIGTLSLIIQIRDAFGVPMEACKVALPLTIDGRSAFQKRIVKTSTPPIEWFFVEITNACNYSCAWCPLHKMTRPKGHMTLDRVKRLFAEISDYQKKRPQFSLYSPVRNPVFLHVMGEPLMHPDIFEVLEIGHKSGLDLCLVTNVSMLNDDRIDKILASGLNSIVLSLNVTDEHSHGKTGSPFAYEQIVGQIQNLIRKRYAANVASPRIEIQILTSPAVPLVAKPFVEHYRQAEGQLAMWLDFVREQERNADAQRYVVDEDEPTRLRNLGEYGANDPRNYFTLGQNVSLVFKKACNFGNVVIPAMHHVQPSQHGNCPFRNAHRVLCIMWDGSCTYCSLDYDNDVNIGNVFADTIESLWAGPRMTRIRQLMDHRVLSEPLCQRCQGSVLRH